MRGEEREGWKEPVSGVIRRLEWVKRVLGLKAIAELEN